MYTPAFKSNHAPTGEPQNPQCAKLGARLKVLAQKTLDKTLTDKDREEQIAIREKRKELGCR